MSKAFVGAMVVCGLIGLAPTGTAMGNGAVVGDEPAIMVSPHVIILAKVATVTVHTNIPATDVERDTVALNDVPAIGVGVDSLGHLVAKFAVADLALEPGEVTLTLSGLYTDGDGFTATDVVTVK